SRSARISQEFRAVPEQSTRGNAIQQSHQSLSGVLHLEHLAAARTELLDHGAKVFLGNVDRELFVRLETLTARTLARDDARPRDLELVALATHSFHQNREVQLATSRDRPRI